VKSLADTLSCNPCRHHGPGPRSAMAAVRAQCCLTTHRSSPRRCSGLPTALAYVPPHSASVQVTVMKG